MLGAQPEETNICSLVPADHPGVLPLPLRHVQIGQGNSTAPAKPLETITSARASKTITRLHAQTMGYEILTEAKIQRIEQWVMHVQVRSGVL